LDQATFGAVRLDLREGLVGRVDLRVIVHGNVDVLLRKLQGDASPNPPCAAGDQRMFPLKWHSNLLL
jgi:hypothetical protein